jgi:hypothetical protein
MFDALKAAGVTVPRFKPLFVSEWPEKLNDYRLFQNLER